MAGGTRMNGRHRLLMRLQSDARLARLAGEGSVVAFEEFVARHRQVLFRTAARLAVPGEGEDLLQQTFLEAWRSLRNGAAPANPRAWMFGIMRHVAINRAHVGHLPLVDELADGAVLEESVLRRAALGELIDALDELPDKQRQALVHAAFGNTSRSELAARLNLSEGAVRGLLYRARSALRAAITVLTPVFLLRQLSAGQQLAAPVIGRLLEGAPPPTGAFTSKASIALLAMATAAGSLVGSATLTGGGHPMPPPTARQPIAVRTAGGAAVPESVRRGGSPPSGGRPSGQVQAGELNVEERGEASPPSAGRSSPLPQQRDGGQETELESSAEGLNGGGID